MAICGTVEQAKICFSEIKTQLEMSPYDTDAPCHSNCHAKHTLLTEGTNNPYISTRVWHDVVLMWSRSSAWTLWCCSWAWINSYPFLSATLNISFFIFKSLCCVFSKMHNNRTILFYIEIEANNSKCITAARGNL